MLLEKIQQDLKEALKAREELRLSTLRMLSSAIHNQEIALRFAQGKPLPQDKGLTDEEVIGVIAKQVKQRKESIEAFKTGKRDDLVKKEEEELQILSKYLPQLLSPEEIKKIVDSLIGEIGAKSPADFGKVMGGVMSKLKGQADGQLVAKIVKESLDKPE